MSKAEKIKAIRDLLTHKEPTKNIFTHEAGKFHQLVNGQWVEISESKFHSLNNSNDKIISEGQYKGSFKGYMVCNSTWEDRLKYLKTCQLSEAEIEKHKNEHTPFSEWVKLMSPFLIAMNSHE